MCTGGIGPNLGNAQDVREIYSATDSYENHSTAGKAKYGNQVCTNKFMNKCMVHCDNNVSLDPEHTSYLVILSHITRADWFVHTRNYREFNRYPEGSKIFNR